ncbi:MAG: hypothetical protein ACYSTG_10295, partial [Planctomycetota bacterium]
MDRALWQSRWKVLVIYVALVRTSRAGSVPQLIWFFVAALFLVAVILILSKAVKILEALEENSAKLERIAEALEKNRSILARIDQGVRLSETAKSIVSRGANRQYLREAVFAKLQQQDFESAYKIIDEIAGRPEYKEFAEQLRAEADKRRDATDTSGIKQTIADIEKLFESYQWTKASAEIESLNKACPESEEAKSLRQKLVDKKEERKR